jgi:hypothetical protein
MKKVLSGLRSAGALRMGDEGSMTSNELFSDEAGASEAGRAPAERSPSRRKLGVKGSGRLIYGLILLIGTFVGITVDAVITAAPAFAAQANACIDPATAGSAQTFYAGVASSTYTVECEEETGISGTSAYPTISIATDNLPADGNPALATGASCTTATSGSGTTEEYIEECKFSDSPTVADESATPYTATFTSTPGAFAGSTLTASTSGTLSVTISAPNVSCIDPAAAGTAATWHEGVTSTYTVECEQQSGVSSLTAYPSSVVVATDALPADSTPSLAACTTGTSGSGTTEEYIKECAFSATPTAADGGSYAATFTATGDGGVGTTTSGALTITVNAATLSCIDPASAGSAATFNSSAGGTVNAYTVECEEASGISGVSAYPTSIAVDPSSSLPADATFSATYNGTGTLPSTCAHTTSGSGATEEYILECDVNETAVSADNGSYTGVFDAVGTGGTPAITSGTLSLTVTGPNDVCTAPANAGTATTFHVGIANTYSVACYGTGFSSANAGNYPASITLNTGTLPADVTEATSLSSAKPCTISTSGSALTEEYILTCTITETPTAADVGTYPVTFTATPGSSGGTTVTSGTWTLSVAGINPTCIDPAAGGSATSFYENTASSYTVECEAQSGVSGTTAYPSSITINTGSLPADGNPTFATSTSSSPACTTGTSGSGTTEEYILECALADTPTSSDGGSYPLTFTATGPAGAGTTTSGTLTVTITPPTTTCSTPASGGTSVSWVDGTAESETITCYSQGFATANAGNYPSAITLNSGTLPSDASEATSTSSSPACTTATSGTGTAEEYELECKVTETPVESDNGTYAVTFLATGGANGAPSVVSGTLTITIKQPAPSWETDSSTDGNYFSAIKGVAFCDTIAVTTSTSGGASTGSLGSLPLTSLTAGTTPANVSNYSIQDVNLATGTAEICGTNNNTAASAPVTMAPVATNSGGSATDSIPLWSQNECLWTSSGTGLNTTVSMFDSNQDLEATGTQSAFGQPITNGVQGGTSLDYPTCTGGVGVSASGGLGDAWTINTANPLPTPTDTNPSASQGDLASSNLDLTSASGGSTGGCWGGTNILASTSTTSFGSGSTARMTLPSSWVNGGNCAYGSLGSNSAGGNTDTPALHGPTGDAACPPNQADVNAGFVDCTEIVSSGNDENGSTNYSSLDLFYNGQAVPQTSTATLSAGQANAGATVNVTGGTNWWGASDGAPNAGPYGDFQNDAANFYPVGAPQISIGTSRGTAVPVVNSTVTIPADTYTCTGAETSTVGPNPCTLTVGQPTGTFQVPSGLSSGVYNVYIDESNTTPLPGNGPNDPYQTARGTNLGTAESTTQIVVGPPVFNSAAAATFAETVGGTFNVSATGYGPVSLSASGLPSWLSLSDNGDGSGSGPQTDTGVLSGTPPYGSAGTYDFSITATDGNSNQTVQSFVLTVSATAPTFTSTSQATFSENAFGTFAVTANGDPPISFTETGALPSGVTLGTDGTLSGTPAFGSSADSPYNVVITATDGNGNTSTENFTLFIGNGAPVISSGTPTDFTENSAGSFQVTSNGDGPFTYTETGALPANVTLSTGGLLSGTPVFGTAGSYPITITVTDVHGNTATQNTTVTVDPGDPVISSGTPTAFTENSAGPSFQVTSNGDGPLTYTETGALPANLTLSTSGVLSGTPAFGTTGSYPITITVTDGNGNTGTQNTSVTVDPGEAVFTSGASTTFTEGVAGSFNVTANGDSPTFTESGALPSGVTLSASGVLSGTPGFLGGQFPITITATVAGASQNATQAFTLYVSPSSDPLHILTTSLPPATKRHAYSGVLTANGGTAPYKWQKTSGAIPLGLKFNSNGTITGKPKGAAKSETFTVKVTDSSSPKQTATATFTITVS